MKKKELLSCCISVFLSERFNTILLQSVDSYNAWKSSSLEQKLPQRVLSSFLFCEFNFGQVLLLPPQACRLLFSASYQGIAQVWLLNPTSPHCNWLWPQSWRTISEKGLDQSSPSTSGVGLLTFCLCTCCAGERHFRYFLAKQRQAFKLSNVLYNSRHSLTSIPFDSFVCRD